MQDDIAEASAKEDIKNIDLNQVRIEIEQEANKRRTQDASIADLERELNLTFARFAPVDASVDDLEAVIARVEEASNIDLLSPIQGDKVAQFAKRLIRKAIRWYIRWIAEQLAGFGHATAKALSLLRVRLESLEKGSNQGLEQDLHRFSFDQTASQDFPSLGKTSASDINHWGPILLKALEGTTGRICVGESASGELLDYFKKNAFDAYGVEPFKQAYLQAQSNGLEVRNDDVLDHLEILGDSVLAALVLTGCVDTYSVMRKAELLDLANKVLVKDGLLVILSSHPSTWGQGLSPVQKDLAPGGPIHPETWQQLLKNRSFSSIEVELAPSEPTFELLPEVDEASKALNTNWNKLNKAYSLPLSYLIFAKAL